jgi:GTP-binding protein
MAFSTRPAQHMLMPFLYPSAAHFTVPCTGLSKILWQQKRTQSSTTSSEHPVSRLNPTPDDYGIASFADKAKITVYAGPGGNGCISFLREAYFPDGPANGGDGGHGGNVYIQAVHSETSLHKLARQRFLRAGRGKHGQGSSKSGPRGEDALISVPVGTVITEIERVDPHEAEAATEGRGRWSRYKPRDPEADREKWLVYPGISSSDLKEMEYPRLPRRDRLYTQPPAPIHLDLSRPTEQPILLAAGGLGGVGNPHFVSKENPRPKFATKGEPAMSLTLEFELKLLADVGLVGLPNAGKSTLLRAVSNSRARVASWAFTTLQPNIGTVVLDDNRGRPWMRSFRKTASSYNESGELDGPDAPPSAPRTRFTIADIPGLIEGAHLDRGLGIAFLRHVERAGVLAFVVDLGAGDAIAALNALWVEVGLYAQMREEEERERERDARIDWAGDGAKRDPASPWPFNINAQAPDQANRAQSGLHIAAKPWLVIATKGDLPDTQENFQRLREYLASITAGDLPHPSGVAGAWTQNCAAIPVSAINGHGVDKVVHWTVGLLDG